MKQTQNTTHIKVNKLEERNHSYIVVLSSSTSRCFRGVIGILLFLPTLLSLKTLKISAQGGERRYLFSFILDNVYIKTQSMITFKASSCTHMYAFRYKYLDMCGGGNTCTQTLIPYSAIVLP